MDRAGAAHPGSGLLRLGRPSSGRGSGGSAGVCERRRAQAARAAGVRSRHSRSVRTSRCASPLRRLRQRQRAGSRPGCALGNLVSFPAPVPASGRPTQLQRPGPGGRLCGNRQDRRCSTSRGATDPRGSGRAGAADHLFRTLGGEPSKQARDPGRAGHVRRAAHYRSVFRRARDGAVPARLRPQAPRRLGRTGGSSVGERCARSQP